MNKQESQEHYHSYTAEARRSSGQSASSGAEGPARNADQGIRYAVIRYEGPIRFEDSVDVVAQDLNENPAVARVPATPTRILRAAKHVVEVHARSGNGMVDAWSIDALHRAAKEFESTNRD